MAALNVRFLDLLKSIDASLHRPDEAVAGAQRFQDLTLQFYLHPDDAVTWYETQIKQEAIKETHIKGFSDICELVYQRYDESRQILIKGLCQLCVVGGDLGRVAMAIVANSLEGKHKQDSLNTVLEVLSPLIEIMESLSPKVQFNIMSTMALFPCEKGLSKGLQPIIHYVANDVTRNPWRTAYLSLLRTACLDEDNVYDVIHYKVAENLIAEIQQTFKSGVLYTDDLDIERLAMLMDTIQITLMGTRPEVISQFCSDILMPNLRTLIGDREGTYRLNPSQALLCSSLIGVCNAILRTGNAVFHELCFGYHLFDLLLVPVKEPIANPLVLAASLRAISVIIEHPEIGLKFVSSLIEEVNTTILLGYLRPERLKHIAGSSIEETNPASAVATFVAHVLDLSRKQRPIFEFVESLYEKGLAVLVLDGLASGNLDPEGSRAFVRVLSRFSIERIDSRVIELMLGLMVPSTLLQFEQEVFEYIIYALRHKLGLYRMDTIVERICWLLVSTLKTVEIKRFRRVHLCCAALLQAVSRTQAGQLLLREEHTSMALHKALKYEQDFCAYDHPDVRIELTCIGGDVEFLRSCMFDTFRLRSSHRQIFRVLRTIGRVLIKYYNSTMEEDLRTIYMICANEVEDFIDETRRRNSVNDTTNQSSDDETNKRGSTDVNVDVACALSLSGDLSHGLENTNHPEPTVSVHRDQQQQLFISMEMPKKIMSYLSGCFSPGLTEQYQNEQKHRRHSEHWAGLLKGQKIDCERSKKLRGFHCGMQEDSTSDSDRASEEVNLGYVLDSSIDKRSRKRISKLVAREIKGSQPDREPLDPFFVVLPKSMLHKVWLNESSKTLNPCFIVSAYLRILYGLLAPSVSTVVREVIKAHMRQPDFVRNLIKLTACSSFLDANLATKFFRLCTRALTIDVASHAESMDMIVIYDIISRFSRDLCSPLKQVTTTVSIDWMERKMEHIQLTILHLFRTLALFAKQTPWIKFSNVLEIQNHFVEVSLIRFIPEDVLSFALRILFQISSMETSNAVGTYVSHMYRSDLLQELRECCVDLAVSVSSAAPNTHYVYLLNTISSMRDANSLHLRPSLVADMLRRIALAGIKKNLQEYLSRKRLERVLLIDDVWTLNRDGKIEDKLIAVTSRAIRFISIGKKGRFQILTSLCKESDVCLIGGSKLYLASGYNRDASPSKGVKDWLVFATRHMAHADFVRFVTSENESIINNCTLGVLEDKPPYMGTCKYKSSLCTIAITKKKIVLMEINATTLALSILQGNSCDEEYSRETLATRESHGSHSDRSDSTEAEKEKPLELLYECNCDSIVKLTYDNELGVTFWVENAEQEDALEVTFLSDSQREEFKRHLARTICHKAWYRHWK